MAPILGNSQGYNGGRFYSTRSRPVLVEGSFLIDSSSPTGVSNLLGANIADVFMYSASPGAGRSGIINPLSSGTASLGYAWVKLNVNYAKFLAGFANLSAPQGDTAYDINASELIIGQPYLIDDEGGVPQGSVTITTNADMSGSLAGKYFLLFDQYGNTFVLWFYLIGFGGSAPTGVSGTLVQVSVNENATANTIASVLGNVIAFLPSGHEFQNSFSVEVATNVVTVTSNVDDPPSPMKVPLDAGTGFAYASTQLYSNLQCWQAVGLPPGFTPTVGQAFVARATGFGGAQGSSGSVTINGTTDVVSIEIVGDPNLTLSPAPQGGSANIGGWIMLEFKAAASNFVYNSDTPADSEIEDTTAPVEPSNGTEVYFSFYVDVSQNKNGK